MEIIKRAVDECFRKHNNHLRKTAEELDINPKTVRKWLDTSIEIKPEQADDQTKTS